MWKEIRGQFLIWFGIVGTILTIISSGEGLLELAHWIKWIGGRWSEALHKAWSYTLEFFGIVIDHKIALALSACLFLVSLTVGSILLERRVNSNIWKVYAVIGLALLHAILQFILSAIVGSSTTNYILTAYGIYIFLSFVAVAAYLVSEGRIEDKLAVAALYTALYWLMRPFLINIFNFIPVAPRAVAFGGINMWLRVALFVVLLLPVIISPAGALRKRLTFILIGVAVIFGLSEVSKQVDRFRNPTAIMDTQQKS